MRAIELLPCPGKVCRNPARVTSRCPAIFLGRIEQRSVRGKSAPEVHLASHCD
jgi:hypothetical protein